MDVLVTGASGFVGGHAAAALRRAGWTVRCLVRRREDAERVADPASTTIGGCTAIAGDLSDGALLARAADGCSAVVHAAGIVAARSYGEMHATDVAVAVEEVSRVLGAVPRFSRDKAAEFVAPGWMCDPSAAQRDLGWEPSMPLEDALAETVAWYRAARWL